MQKLEAYITIRPLSTALAAEPPLTAAFVINYREITNSDDMAIERGWPEFAGAAHTCYSFLPAAGASAPIGGSMEDCKFE